jgi:hypothetical protein
MTFEIWDTVTRNMLGDFDSEEAALVVVREAIAEHGQEYVATLALVSEDARGRFKTLATGHALVERAESLAA